MPEHLPFSKVAPKANSRSPLHFYSFTLQLGISTELMAVKQIAEVDVTRRELERNVRSHRDGLPELNECAATASWKEAPIGSEPLF